MKKFLSSKVFRFIWSAGLAVLIYFICPPCFSKSTLLILLAIELILINGADFIARLPWLTHIARFLVGGLFIFSGFIKANDPLGFSYKLKEYFEVFQADTGLGFFELFAHIALPLAIIICASEIILGVMLLIGYKTRLTLWLLFAQIAFFTFLTFYSACYNKVTHCGCFGDFLPMKPWESFWKDIVLLVLITLLFAGKDNIRELFAPMVISTLFLMGVVFSIGFPIYTYRNLPPLDFRAYAPGLSIKDGMKTSADYKAPVYESVLVYENIKDHSLKEFNNDAYMKSKIWEDTLNWKWHETKNKLISDAVNPPRITDFTVTDLNGNNITDSLLNDKNYSFWIIMHELALTEEDETLMAQVNDLYKLATEDHHRVIALTASSSKEIDDFKHRHNALYDFAMVDNTVLKTMIRSNPGLMLMKDGTVIMNWHHHNFPTYSDAKQKYMK
ncbi:MAG: BT_3928 family protein [Bacteroidota bacterium]